MARQLPIGTPTRTRSYVFPERQRRALLLGIGAGLVLVILLLGLWFTGSPTALNPAPVAAVHAAFEQECVQCHVVGGEVSDVRCERCHDSASSQRLSTAAHVLLGSREPRKALDAVEQSCMSCHTEHLGREFGVARVDDRRCGACHEFASLDQHPEFAAARAQIQTGVGLLFNHEAHFAKGGLRGCEPCHQATPDLRGFEPLSFERGCTEPCHFHVDQDGFLLRQPDPVLSDTVLIPPPAQLPPPAAASRVQVVDDRGETVITRVSHADPWLMLAARTLGRRIDPEQEALFEASLGRQILWLQQQIASPPLSDVPIETLLAWRAELELEARSLAARVDVAADATGEQTALQQVREGLAELVAQLPELDGDLAAERQALVEAVGSPAPLADVASDPASDADRRTRRVQEIEALIDAVRARAESAGDLALVGEIELLRTAVAGLAGQGNSAAAEPLTDVSTLDRRLQDLDSVLAMVAEVENPFARLQLQQIRLVRDLARQQLRQGLTSAELEDRRSELLELLAWIQTDGPEEMQLEAFMLRQRVLSLRPGDSGLDNLRLTRSRTERLLERVDLELELQEAGVRGRRLARGSLRDQALARRQVERLQARRDALVADVAVADPLPGYDREALVAAFGELMTPCTRCHTLEGARLAPMRASEPVYERARFDHAPHMTIVECDSCHGDPDATETSLRGVYGSTSARDLNVPGVDNCQSCHTPEWAGGDCELCHVYHPVSSSTVLFR